MSSLFRRKLDELEDMFIASQDDLLARFSATYEENKRLKAEVERLTQLQVETLNERNKAEAEVERLTKALEEEAACQVGHQENAILIGRLEAQVERLTKAGDEMAADLPPCGSVIRWNAAKGVQS